MIYFDCLTKQDMEKIREWRNKDIAGARTPYLITAEMQEAFYETVICNRDSHHRYWAICKEGNTIISDSRDIGRRLLIGIAGLTNIEWENRRAEISLMINPSDRGQGRGKEALSKLLDKGFYELNLEYIHGEAYKCNKSIGFWIWMAKYAYYSCTLPNRKYCNGWYDAVYFDFRRDTQIDGI